MNKKARIILNIFFWLFVFGMGLLMIDYLPKVYVGTKLYDEVNLSIQNNEYNKTLSMMELYYDSNPAYESDKLYVFASAGKQKENDKIVIQKKYVCIIKNVDKEKINGNGENKSKIILNNDYQIDLLSIDSDGDDKIDSVSTLINYDFIYFNIPYQCVEGINKISLIDKDDNEQYSANVSLSFNEDFFKDVSDVASAYENNSLTENLVNEFTNKKSTYGIASTKDLQKKANINVFVIMLIYSVVILIIFDATLGMHFTWIPVKKFYKRFIKKTKEEVVETPKYQGNSKLTIKVVVPNGYNNQIKISGKGTKEENKFDVTLRKSNGYQIEVRTLADTYTLASSVEIENMPETLILDSYFKILNLTINEGGSSDGSNITKAK